MVRVFGKTWRPSASQPVDPNAVETYIRDVAERCQVQAVYADPFQFYGSLRNLQGAVNIKEYAQTEAHTQRMAGVLYGLLHTRDLMLYPNDDLRQEILSAVAVEKESGFRLAKASAGRKIDMVAALAMTCVGPWTRLWIYRCAS